jgi:membrane associated rhomboid family serine protease
LKSGGFSRDDRAMNLSPEAPHHMRSRRLPIETLPVVLIVICALIELVLSAADHGLISPARLRYTAYEYGGFWPGLLRDWKPNFAGQPVLMYFTYGFLHGGPVHLIVNMFTLYSLGRAVVDRVGNWRFCVIYLAALLGGAGLYGLLASGLQPMVGASGALFGLAGAIVAWNYADRRAYNLGLWPVGRAVLLLLGLNLVLWWAMKGQLAWQTHLGGFLAGAAAAWVLGRNEH